MIQRTLLASLRSKMFKGKVITILGARQVGKSTLTEMLLSEFESEHTILRLSGDDTDVRHALSSPNSSLLRQIVGKHDIVVIDEAQRIPEIGLVLKIMVDTLRGVQVIATGSSSFELAGKINEPLTGRKWEYTLYPISFSEMVDHTHFLEETRMLEQRLVYGSYPEIVTNPGEARDLLYWLSESYLYKDILRLNQISRPLVLEKLLHAVALQIGSEVNFNELAQLVGSDRGTVEKYLDLLEKAYILFKLPALSGNLRNEIKKGKKFYFYDTGIRNAVLGNFNTLHTRSDVGALFENYVIAERIKVLKYQRSFAKSWFWRTNQQQEIDYIESHGEKYRAVEIKWNPKKRAQISRTFTGHYPVQDTFIVTSDNYNTFLLQDA